jgi:diadenosine tetraphosphate (Ap4A) HIT family hydrolase
VKRIAKSEALARVADEPRTTCLMCGLAGGGAAIAENAHAIALLDRYPTRPGEVLVILRRHEERLTALARDEAAALHELGWNVARAIDRALAPKRI